MDYASIKAAAGRWIADWNSRDLDRILDHYSDDVCFYSTTVTDRWGRPDGRLNGKEELRKHFQQGLDLPPESPFELLDLLQGVDGVLVVYKMSNGKVVADYVVPDEHHRAKIVRVFNAVKLSPGVREG